MNEENNVLTIKTVQIQPIRNMITAIKDILTDATITFTRNGINICDFDKTQTILVNVILESIKFESYTIIPNQIIVCVNTSQLFKLISTMSNDDTLTIYIDKNDYNDGVVTHLGLQYENGSIKQCSTQKLRLIDPNTDNEDFPENLEYSTIINLPTSDFQKVIRDMNGISDRIEIKSVSNDIIFNCEGPFAKSEIYRSESSGNMEFVQKNDNNAVIQGEYSLKSLSHFIKCTPLCSHLEMYLGNDLPLIIKYDVASLGEIKLCLSSLPSLN